MKIGFLFLHEAPHQIAHSLPIALSLSNLRPDIEVQILFAPGEGMERIAALAGVTPHRCTLVPLRLGSQVLRATERLSGNSIPLGRIALLRANLDRFRALDALVVPEKTSLLLKTRFGLKDLKLIHTRHGAGDRAIGFDRAAGQFDFMLLPGGKVRRRMDQLGMLKPGNHAITGYAKFDTIPGTAPRLFDNDRPTILYNPHPSPGLSSWYGMGRAILDYFAASRDWNLIFAPHVMLFRRPLTISLNPPSIARPGKVAARYRSLPHMLIDTGSTASVDMTYTEAADVYLGDASSQVYEFLRRPRPCLFANPYRIAWRGDPNFAYWQAGPVFESIEELGGALERAVESHADHAPTQEALFADTFDLRDTPSSERAAQAIAAYLGTLDRRAAA